MAQFRVVPIEGPEEEYRCETAEMAAKLWMQEFHPNIYYAFKPTTDEIQFIGEDWETVAWVEKVVE
jgi:hypothetical protein